jgi:hypothetical protein
MTQDTHYPEPEQLKTFAQEPNPFHQLYDYEWEFNEENGNIIIDCGNVVYVFEATYINVETAKDEWHRVSDIDFDMSHENAWDWKDDIAAQEDFINAVGTVLGKSDSPIMYNAFWILDRVEILHL